VKSIGNVTQRNLRQREQQELGDVLHVPLGQRRERFGGCRRERQARHRTPRRRIRHQTQQELSNRSVENQRPPDQVLIQQTGVRASFRPGHKQNKQSPIAQIDSLTC
jgi:hypothetical protein